MFAFQNRSFLSYIVFQSFQMFDFEINIISLILILQNEISLGETIFGTKNQSAFCIFILFPNGFTIKQGPANCPK